MKFLRIIVAALLAFSVADSRAIGKRDNDYINDLYNLNISENSFFNSLSNTFNNISAGFLNWIYSVANFYQATSNALNYMQSTESVTITEESQYYFFDGPGTEKALVFYQGAKVDEKAYAEILHNLALNGFDCFLVKMPLRLALFGKNKAQKIMNQYPNYQEWYIAGHSFGGAVAAMFAAQHTDEIQGIAMLAAYSTKKLPDTMKIVSIVASNDAVLNWDNYNKNKSNLPGNFTEVVIEGGNHAQFGDYGEQSGDGVATISMEEQHQIIINAITQEFN